MPRKPKVTDPSEAFSGRWKITEMEQWDQEDFDSYVPAHFTFKGEDGEFEFIVVYGDMDCHYSVGSDGRPRVDFTWEGTDEGEPLSGGGWAGIEADGTLRGRLMIHHGDSSDFAAKRQPASKKASGKRR